MAKTAKKKKKVKLSAQEKKVRKIKTSHKAMVRSILRQTGFYRVVSLADKEFDFDGQKSDFDDVYIQENIVICVEYTTTKNIGDHLKTKKIVYDKIEENPDKFIKYLGDLSDEIKNKILAKYKPEQVQIRVLYCSRYPIEGNHKSNIKYPIYLDYPELRYFKNVTDCVKKSAFDELIDFFKISEKQLGKNGVIGISSSKAEYNGSLLPEPYSNFPKGFKIVTFYIDPESLIKRAYVLRKDGWRDSSGMYQRMISKAKINGIRKYLKVQRRVFINNIITTLDDKTKILDENDNTVDTASLTTTQNVKISLPSNMNTIGLVDGQHRTFAYYESVEDDMDIASLRRQQNLLMTGIIYPTTYSIREREKFEARLFLEINSTQTNAKSNLKQAINLVLEPFLPESIATRVFDGLEESSGPLNGLLERYWFDNDKVKSTSVISYGLKALVKTSGTDSLYYLWGNSEKGNMVANEDLDILDEYVTFCVSTIDQLLIAVKQILPSDKWTSDKKTADRFLTTTNLNSLLICLRFLIENNKTGDQNYYRVQLKNLRIKDFKGVHSSQYAKLAELLFKKYFI